MSIITELTPPPQHHPAGTDFALRLLWTQSAANPGIFFCAQKLRPDPANLKEVDAEVWKIGTYAVPKTNGPIHLSRLHYLSTIRASVDAGFKVGGKPHMKDTDRFTYDQMMALMQTFYRSSSPDPFKSHSDHFEHELKRHRRRQAALLEVKHE